MGPLPACCWGPSANSPRAGESWRSKLHIRQVNESLYELHDPPSNPSMLILFFHGLYSSNALDIHLSTWESEDGSFIWPETWLVGKFPGARVLYVSYSAGVGKSSQIDFDMHVIVENLVSDFWQDNIGQTPNCPVILVGYCFGGLVIKQLCLQINARMNLTKFQSERTKLKTFLGNIKAIFYYGTPHRGSPSVDKVARVWANPLLKYFKTLSKEASRLNFEFSQLCKVHGDWQIQGLGESITTKWGLFRGVVVAPEACARDGDQFSVVPVDHLSISKPPRETDRRFYALTNLLRDIVGNLEANGLGHQCYGLPSHPIALQKRAKDCEEKLKHVAILGVFGMGGIGKTAIAKQVYNNISKEFEYTCFVDNVKGTSMDPYDQHGLADYLLSHFYQLGRKVDRIEWFDLKEKKTLIVLDDIDSENQLLQLPKLYNFGGGSRIILTSRNKEVFKVYENYDIYEVRLLKEDEARELFCQHVFGLEEIPQFSTPMNHLSKNVSLVVDKCGGLPLTIEVMGCYLRGYDADTEVWEETIDKLGKAQAIGGGRNDRVWGSLKVSYDALAEEEQEMFMEAATCFFEQPLDQALAAWSTTAGNSKTRWANLVSRSMVKEVWKEHFSQFGYLMGYKVVWLHEQLRDLAASLAKGYGIFAQVKEAEKVVNLLNAKKMNQKIRILELRCDSPITVKFLDLENLKYLDFLSIHMHEGLVKNFPKKLSVLRWTFDNITFTTNNRFTISLNEMNNLAFLELGGWDVPQGFVEELGNLPNLRILSLSRMRGLDRFPENFGNLSLLQQLELKHCDLRAIPESFGSLSALEQLTLKDVKCLELPESFGDLQALKALRIASCEKLSNLPSSFGNLLLLKNLCIESCPLLKTLPPSFSQLSGLQQLAIYNCEGLRDLGNSFGALSSLRLLILKSTGLEQLPDNFGLLSTLEELTLGEPGPLKALPDNFGQLKALRILDMAAPELETLPDSFGLLTSLQNLTILSPSLTSLPENLGDLSGLEKLHLVVDYVKVLPDSLGKLSVLQRLTIYAESLQRLPTSIGQLSSLQHLWVYCPQLKQLPTCLGELSSLQKLAIGSMNMDNFPNSKLNLQLLRFLYLRAESMSDVPESIGELSSLPEFKFSSDWQDRMLEEYDSLNQDTSHLVLYPRKLKVRPEGVKFGMQRLERLPEQLGKLTALRKLTLLNCDMLAGIPDSVGHIPSLREINLDTCVRLKSLPSSWERRSSSSQGAPPQEARGKKIMNLVDEPLSWTAPAERLRLIVNHCPYLCTWRLERLDWAEVRGEKEWMIPHYRKCRGGCCGMYTRKMF